MLLPSLLFPLLQIPLCMSSSSHGTCNHPFLLKDLRFLIAATTDLMGMQLFSIAVQGTHTHHQSGLLLVQEQCEIHYIHILPASLPRKINVLKLSSLIDVPSIHPSTHPLATVQLHQLGRRIMVFACNNSPTDWIIYSMAAGAAVGTPEQKTECIVWIVAGDNLNAFMPYFETPPSKTIHLIPK